MFTHRPHLRKGKYLLQDIYGDVFSPIAVFHLHRAYSSSLQNHRSIWGFFFFFFLWGITVYQSYEMPAEKVVSVPPLLNESVWQRLEPLGLSDQVLRISASLPQNIGHWHFFHRNTGLQQDQLVDVNHPAEAELEQARNDTDGRGRYLEELVAMI